MNNSRYLDLCVCCGSDRLTPYLNLGHQPPPNAFHNNGIHCTKFPLETNVCQRCYHSQLKYAVDPSLLFENYVYRTGVSETLVKYYKELASKSLISLIEFRRPEGFKKSDVTSILNVLDIGCNDGTLLQAFKQLGCITTGVDPFKVPGIDDEIDFFEEGFWGELIRRRLKHQVQEGFDIVTATNVLAHNISPKLFLIYAEQVLKDDGLIIIEVPYGKNLLEQCQFDTIYHEHYSYFNANSIVYLLGNTGLCLHAIQQVGVHGGSLRIELKKCEVGKEIELSLPVAGNLINQEVESELIGSMVAYQSFQSRVDEIKHQFLNLHAIVEAGYRKLIGFGASAKSTVFLNYVFNKFPLERLQLECIIDETPEKVGKLSPGLNIPIYDLDYLDGLSTGLEIVIMSWNCMEETLRKLRQIRSLNHMPRNCDFILTYVPRVERKPLFFNEPVAISER